MRKTQERGPRSPYHRRPSTSFHQRTIVAAANLLALIDDIATLLDDVSLLTKVAAKKTAGVLGDDLALNAEQVSGVAAQRELPVVWAVAKGSVLNKAILVPLALAISALAPWAVTPLLMLGGLYLCYEGAEKLAHRWLHGRAGHAADAPQAAAELEQARTLAQHPQDLQAFERQRIKGAIRTDFILSAEIVVIALGTVATQPLATQLAVLAGISLMMTAGVYGLVAGIVKLDDLGLLLARRRSAVAQQLGRVLLAAAPLLMKTLSVAGTAAMFLVGGGILAHGLPPLHHAVEALQGQVPAGGWLVGGLAQALAGVVAGMLVLAVVALVQRLRGGSAH
jgi:predicted DNA repair protein MutK